MYFNLTKVMSVYSVDRSGRVQGMDGVIKNGPRVISKEHFIMANSKMVNFQV